MSEQILERALDEWKKGEFYDAHETLEEFVESVEDNDEDWEIGLALVHIAAALHKFTRNVGARAVPGKLEKAIQALESAPDEWYDLDLATLRDGVRTMLSAYRAGEHPDMIPTLRVVE